MNEFRKFFVPLHTKVCEAAIAQLLMQESWLSLNRRIADVEQKNRIKMIGTAAKSTPDTFTLTVPKADVSFFKTMAKKMGWTIERKRTTAKPRLYDPETGDCLNDATMKVIEDARKGKNVIEVGSMDDYLKLVSNL